MKVVPLARRARELSRGREVLQTRPRRSARWVALGSIFILIVLVTAPMFWRDTIPHEPGKRLDGQVVSELTFEYTSPRAEQLLEEERQANYPRIYAYDYGRQMEAKDRLEDVIDAARGIQTTGQDDPESWKKELTKVDPQLEHWSASEVRDLVMLAKDQRFRRFIVQLVDNVYRDYLLTRDKAEYLGDRKNEVARELILNQPPDLGTQAFDLDRIVKYPDEIDGIVRERLRQKLQEFSQEQAARAQAGLRLVMMVLEPNFYKDEKASQESYDSYQPSQGTQRVIEQGTVLVGKEGEVTILSDDEADLLAVYWNKLLQRNLMKFMAQLLFILIAFLIVAFFVMKFSREHEFTSQTVLLIGLPVLLALAIGRMLLFLMGEDISYMGFAFPAGVIGILGVLLLDVRMALLTVTWGCLLFGLEVNLDYQYVIVGLFGGYTAVAALYTFRERREVLYAGLFIGLVNASIILIITYIHDPTANAAAAALVGALSGVMCPLISFAILPVFEVLFHITTDMRLLELSGLQHPLLRKLEETAPGTWQHTLNVTKLAESAASEIGVNYLLVRTGCYFHDVGKMGRAEYFTENQLTPEDKRRHAELKPQMSTLIIRNHVKEGIELAKQYKLPRQIIEFIPQHHGTSLIQYFYHKALTAAESGDSKEPVREDDYRYPGPKPQSIEAAIVMLADTVEATATAKLSGRTVREDDIRMLVRNAIFDKFNDGQFDHCNMTLRDLNTIRECFVKVLRSRFHSRIDYPSKKDASAKKEKAREEKPAPRKEAREADGAA
ncbi:HDIG domain-containing protein [bacterium]|nr:HDIG domain-containing protein [bacterium]